METGSEDQNNLEALEARLRTILPEEYQETYEEVQPVSMGSAKLEYGPDGKVSWDEIWDSFCDLAMAGGPPHKGSLLEPGSREEIDAQPDRYGEVVAEICRGITLVSELAALPALNPGWVRVEGDSAGMAEWLLRAIIMENISARSEGEFLELPAGPAYRVEKEIKNVITVIAKTCHYWADHMWVKQQREIAGLFVKMSAQTPLLQPASGDANRSLHTGIAAMIEKATGLQSSAHRYDSWLGVDCPNIRAAIWMMRALVASNVLARREGTVLFVPVNPESDPKGETVARAVIQIHGFATERGIIA